MAQTEAYQGENWRMYAEENVVVAEFYDSEAFEDELDEIIDAFFGFVERDEITAHVACLELDGAAGNPMLEGAEKAAREAQTHGLEKWAVVADGIGKLAVKNQVDLPDIEVLTAESEAEALAWAKA